MRDAGLAVPFLDAGHGVGVRFVRESGGGLLEFLHETGDRVGELGALTLPVGETFRANGETDGLTRSHRVVVADAFDETAVATAAAVSS